MAVVRLPAVDPAEVRKAAGFSPRGTWFSPRQLRPAAFKAMQGQPSPEDGQILSFQGRS